VIHEVRDLQPETKYTIQVGLVGPDESRLVEELFEARTANATTALFADEDWGRSSAKGKDGKDCKDGKETDKDGKESGGASSSWMSSPGASSSSAGAAAAASGNQAGRGDSQDEISTIAPSEGGEDAARRDDNVSESGSESGVNELQARRADDRQRSSASSSSAQAPPPILVMPSNEPVESLEAVQEVKVIEVTPVTKRAVECKFCSVLDCLKMGGSRNPLPAVNENELVIERQVAPKPEPKPTRKFRPYRTPFPGRPVDPKSVGLQPGPGDLV
jgi:hypothetical protein